MFLAKTPPPPYWAVIFTSIRTSDGQTAYEKMAQLMVEMASRRPGFLGIESTRDGEGNGITVSYWSEEADIGLWKADSTHLRAQAEGKDSWYAEYKVRVCRVERDYGF